jgi:hypothetical protein
LKHWTLKELRWRIKMMAQQICWVLIDTSASQLQHKRALKRLKLNIQSSCEICIYANATLQSAPVTTVAPHVYVPGTLVLYCIPCVLAMCSHSLIVADLKRVTDLSTWLCVGYIYRCMWWNEWKTGGCQCVIVEFMKLHLWNNPTAYYKFNTPTMFGIKAFASKVNTWEVER